VTIFFSIQLQYYLNYKIKKNKKTKTNDEKVKGIYDTPIKMVLRKNSKMCVISTKR